MACDERQGSDLLKCQRGPAAGMQSMGGGNFHKRMRCAGGIEYAEEQQDLGSE